MRMAGGSDGILDIQTQRRDEMTHLHVERNAALTLRIVKDEVHRLQGDARLVHFNERGIVDLAMRSRRLNRGGR